jgi:hypothetical protein
MIKILWFRALNLDFGRSPSPADWEGRVLAMKGTELNRRGGSSSIALAILIGYATGDHGERTRRRE